MEAIPNLGTGIAAISNEGDEAPPRLTVEKALWELDEAVANVGADAPALAGYREHLEGLGS